MALSVFFRLLPGVGVFTILLAGCPAMAPKENALPDGAFLNTPEEGISRQADITYLYLRFENARLKRDAAGALAALQELLPLAPSPSLYAQAGAYYLDLRRIDEARETLKQGVSLYPDSYPLCRLLAETYLLEERPADAIVTLQDYIEAYPQNTAARQDYILLLVQNHRYADAEALIKKTPDAERSPFLLYYHAAALNGLGKKNEALAELKKAVARDPSFFEAWAELAYLYEQRGNAVEAERAYERAIALDPENQEIWLRLVTISLSQKNPAKALELALQGPQSPAFLLTCASLFMTEKYFDEARQVLDMAVRTPDMPPEVFFYQAVLAFEHQRDFDAAIKWLDRIPESSAYYGRALRMRSQIQFENNDMDGAFKTLDRAVELFPDEPDLRLAQVQLLIQADRMSEAAAAMEALRSRWPEDVEIEYRYGLVLSAAKRNDEAMDVMESVIQRNPEHAEALNYVGYTLADENRDLDRALALILKADKLLPDSAHIKDSVAWVYYRLGKMHKAWEAIVASTKLGGDDPAIWEHYAAIAKALGKKSEANKAEARARELRLKQEGK